MADLGWGTGGGASAGDLARGMWPWAPVAGATRALLPWETGVTPLSEARPGATDTLTLRPGQRVYLTVEPAPTAGGPVLPGEPAGAGPLAALLQGLLDLLSRLGALLARLLPTGWQPQPPPASGIAPAPLQATGSTMPAPLQATGSTMPAPLQATGSTVPQLPFAGGPTATVPPTPVASSVPPPICHCCKVPCCCRSHSAPPVKKGKRAIDDHKMDALECAFGRWVGKGKNKNPRASTGKQGHQLFESAYAKLQRGDTAGAYSDWHKATRTSSPIMFDLNGDGKLGTTGVSTAKNRVDGKVGRTVRFDIDGDGRKDAIEWSDGRGDGILVDDRDGGASRAAAGNGEIDGRRLFGDQGGKFADGYQKLGRLDGDADGALHGGELSGLKVWVDDGDAKVEAGELKTLDELGITQVSTRKSLQRNERGEDLMRSTYVQDGQERVSEDVWFAAG